MIKIIGLVIALTLFSQTVVARDYKTVFHAKIIAGDTVADSDCGNTQNEIIPISDDLANKGWTCVLLPKKLVSNVYGLAIACQNKNGTMVNTVVNCASNQPSNDKGSFNLDDMNQKVKGTIFILTCSTSSGERI